MNISKPLALRPKLFSSLQPIMNNRKRDTSEHFSTTRNEALTSKSQDIHRAYQNISNHYSEGESEKIIAHLRYTQAVTQENEKLKLKVQTLTKEIQKYMARPMENERIKKLSKVLSYIPEIRYDIIKEYVDIATLDRETSHQSIIDCYLNKIKALNEENQCLQNKLLTCVSNMEQDSKTKQMEEENTAKSKMQLQIIILENNKYQQEINDLRQRMDELEKSKASLDQMIGERDKIIAKLKTKVKNMEESYASTVKSYQGIIQHQTNELKKITESSVKKYFPISTEESRALAKLCNNTYKVNMLQAA